VFFFLPGNHTVAVIKGKESFETLQSSCSRIFNDVNNIVKTGFIKIGENQVPVEIFLGGDYKVILGAVLFLLTKLIVK
jgi:hypothetical protein